MTQGIFHVTVAALVGAMTVAGVAIAMAPSSEVTAPSAPLLLQQSQPLRLHPLGQLEFGQTVTVPVVPTAIERDTPEVSTAIKDACVVEALGQLPKIDGMRITQSSYKYDMTDKRSINGIVSVSIEVRGHQAHYGWLCAVTPDGIVILIARR